jgi:hypothetical protein
MDSQTASSNTKYLRQMVKLDAKNEMPDAKSFLAQTSVAHAETPPSAQSAFTTDVASSTSDAKSNWQTVSATPSPLRGMTH